MRTLSRRLMGGYFMFHTLTQYINHKLNLKFCKSNYLEETFDPLINQYLLKSLLFKQASTFGQCMEINSILEDKENESFKDSNETDAAHNLDTVLFASKQINFLNTNQKIMRESKRRA